MIFYVQENNTNYSAYGFRQRDPQLGHLYIPLENSLLFQLKSIHPKNYKPTFGKTKRWIKKPKKLR